MDRKAILVVSASIGFIILWSLVIVPKYFSKPLPPGATNAIVRTEAAPGINQPAGTTTSAPVNEGASIKPVEGAAQPFVAPALEEETMTVTYGDARYVFTSHGGGVKEIELLRYPEMVAKGRKGDTNRVATLNAKAKVPVMAILGDAALQGDGVFKLLRSADGVRAEKELANGLVIVKDFQATSNYLFEVTVRLENRSTSVVTVSPQEWVVGTATPMNAMDTQASANQGVMWSDGEKTHDTPKSWFDNASFLSCLGKPSVPRTEYRGGADNVTWVSAHNQFFAIVAVPPTNAPARYDL